MPCYVISYDLDKPGRNYDELYKLIKSYSGWCHAMESTWFVATNDTSSQIRDKLTPAFDDNDKLFVGRMQGEGAWRGLSAEITKWLKENL